MQKYSPNFWKDIILTHREQVPEGLHHYVPVQGSLRRVQAFPLLWREFNGHILEGQSCLKFKKKHLTKGTEAEFLHIK